MAALDLLRLIHNVEVGQDNGRMIAAVARVIALWRGEREWGSSESAKIVEDRVWRVMARTSIKTWYKAQK